MKRRRFLEGSLVAGGAMMLPGCAAVTRPFSRVWGAGGDVRVAVAGVRGKGKHHVQMLREIPGVRVVALCDPDEEVLAERVQTFAETNEKVDTYQDVRHVLDRSDVDAITIATPNHWHSLIAIWACQAGKDVYVEKPVSHNVWEGRKLVEAARKHDRIVQTGIQWRSDRGCAETIQYIREGNLGRILWAHGLCFKPRPSIGKVGEPTRLPDSINYNLWTGPAPLEPLMRERLHYDWHWVWPTGNGDIGNQGVHEMDVCRWMLGQEGLPPRVMSVGGRFGYDDDGTTANTQLTILDYDSAPLLFEVRGLPRQAGGDQMDHYRQIRVGVVIQCEEGYFAGGNGGGWVYDNEGNRIKQFKAGGAETHMANFIDAVRSRRAADLKADVLKGHISSALCHLGNISYRIGTESSPEAILEAVRGESEAVETFERIQEHLGANGVDSRRTPPVLGPWLKLDPACERFVGGEGFEQANDLLSRKYREPFIVPEQV